MADPYRITDDWQEGYDSGYDTGYFEGMKRGREQRMNMRTSSGASVRSRVEKPKRKMPQKGKAKVLTTMTKPIWAKYKKGSGKKTYVEVRAQVSRSQAYKKKTKGMK